MNVVTIASIIILFVTFIPTYLGIGLWYSVSGSFGENARLILLIFEVLIFGIVQLVFGIYGLIILINILGNKNS